MHSIADQGHVGVCASHALPKQRYSTLCRHAVARSGSARPRSQPPGPPTTPIVSQPRTSEPPQAPAPQWTTHAPHAAGTSSARAAEAVLLLVQALEELGVEHWLRGWAAALVQGVPLPSDGAEARSALAASAASGGEPGSSQRRRRGTSTVAPPDASPAPPPPLLVSVQWDAMPQVHQAFQRALSGTPPPSPAPPLLPAALRALARRYRLEEEEGAGATAAAQPRRGVNGSSFTLRPIPASSGAGLPPLPALAVSCERSTVVAAEEARVRVPLPAPAPAPRAVHAESLWAVRSRALGTGACFGDGSSSATDAPQRTGQVQQQQLAAAVTARLAALQREVAAVNSAAWAEGDTYGAWARRYGSPARAAAEVVADPAARLGPALLRHLWASAPGEGAGEEDGEGEEAGLRAALRGRRVVNLLGSHGLKAVALGRLTGRGVTVVDVSPGNRRYALEVAEHAQVPLRYILADVLRLREVVPMLPRKRAARGEGGRVPEDEAEDAPLWGSADLVLMEQGVLHYFFDLQALFGVVRDLLAPGGGRLLLRDFHPVSTKLVASQGAKHKVAGDYFSTVPAGSPAAFIRRQQRAAAGGAGNGGPASSREEVEKEQAERTQREAGGAGAGEQPGVLLRRWTLGEVVTACAAAGLAVRALDEQGGPKAADRGLPKTFTLVAARP